MKRQASEIIEQYLEAYKGKDFANRTLARKIIRDNKGVFEESDLESVRGKIRYHRGALGKDVRHKANPEYVREEMKPSEYMKEYINQGKITYKGDWHLPKEYRKPLILSDLHIPYHHLPAIDVTLDHAFGRGVDSIYINGDLIDFAKISRWEKDPHTIGVQVEIDQVRDFLEGLAGLGLPIFYKLGNHEERWNAYLIREAPELYDLDALQMESVLGLDDLGIELIGGKQKAVFGKHLNVLHGHEFGHSMFSPVNPARGLFLRAKTNVIAGHNHQTSSHHENDLKGKPTATFSTGCLCDLQPDYRPFGYTKWNHGAAIVELDEDGDFSVQNFRVMKGKVRG